MGKERKRKFSVSTQHYSFAVNAFVVLLSFMEIRKDEVTRGESAVVTGKIYGENHLKDISAAYQRVILDLYEAGCRNIQLDDCTWASSSGYVPIAPFYLEKKMYKHIILNLMMSVQGILNH